MAFFLPTQEQFLFISRRIAVYCTDNIVHTVSISHSRFSSNTVRRSRFYIFRVRVEFFTNERSFKERLQLYFIKNQRSSEYDLDCVCLTSKYSLVAFWHRLGDFQHRIRMDPTKSESSIRKLASDRRIIKSICNSLSAGASEDVAIKFWCFGQIFFEDYRSY